MRLSTAVHVIVVAVLVTVVGATWTAAQEPTEPAPAPTAAPAPAPSPVPSAVSVPKIYAEALKVELKGRTDFKGSVSMEVTVHGQEPKLVSVDVIPKMSADDIVEDLFKELTLALGNDFKVKDKGDRVVIEKANKKAPNISLRNTGQSILGVSFLIDKD